MNEESFPCFELCWRFVFLVLLSSRRLVSSLVTRRAK